MRFQCLVRRLAAPKPAELEPPVACCRCCLGTMLHRVPPVVWLQIVWAVLSCRGDQGADQQQLHAGLHTHCPLHRAVRRPEVFGA